MSEDEDPKYLVSYYIDGHPYGRFEFEIEEENVDQWLERTLSRIQEKWGSMTHGAACSSPTEDDILRADLLTNEWRKKVVNRLK
jgi:hypothetical protein